MAKIAFFGTPEFSLPSLLAVNDFCNTHGHELSLVVSQKDKKQGRGQHLLPPAVKFLALQLGLRVAQPETLKKNTAEGDAFFELFSSLNLDLAIVVAYGKIITQRLLNIPNQGFVNVHASLLPKYRGAAPIQRAIMSGDTVTGVCLMDMILKLDEGDVFTCAKSLITPFDTSYTLSRRLAKLGAHLLSENLSKLIKGQMAKKPQSSMGMSYASMLSKEEGLLDFNAKGKTIQNKVRALDPWPASFAFIKNKRVKFFNSFFVPSLFAQNKYTTGQIVSINPFLGVQCEDGIIFFEAIQFEGKKILQASDALRGLALKIGDSITLS